MSRADVTGAQGPSRILVGRYRLVDLIARGGMAEVWRGQDGLLARPVAVKLPLSHLSQQDSFRDRFRREAVSAARLSHPNVVAIYDSGTDGHEIFIVMELVRGPSLRQVLDRERALSPAQALPITAQVASALDFAHRSGIVHRDIKPANILLGREGVAKVADFGIAKAADDLSETRLTIGTARYLSPEQVEGLRADGRSDIYSLGVVLFEMLCGRAPFVADNEIALALKHTKEDPPRPSEVATGLPSWLDDIVLRALAKDPAQRFPTASDMREALIGGVSDNGSVGLDRKANLRQADARKMPTKAQDRPGVQTTGLPWATSPGETLDTSEPGGGDGRDERPRRRLVPWVAAAVAVAAVSVGSVLAVQLEHKQHAGSTAPATAPRSSSVPVANVQSYDPFGDGTEDQAGVSNLIDGNSETFWHTDQYDSRAFGNLKPGVGFYLVLAGSRRLGNLALVSLTPGWSAQVYVAQGLPNSFAGWGSPVNSIREITGPEASFALKGKTGRYVLLWITHLGPTRAVRIGEVRLTT